MTYYLLQYKLLYNVDKASWRYMHGTHCGQTVIFANYTLFQPYVRTLCCSIAERRRESTASDTAGSEKWTDPKLSKHRCFNCQCTQGSSSPTDRQVSSRLCRNQSPTATMYVLPVYMFCDNGTCITSPELQKHHNGARWRSKPIADAFSR